MAPSLIGERSLITNTNLRTAVLRGASLLLGVLAPICVFLWQVGAAPQEPPPAIKYPQELGRVTFAVAGDVIPHEPVVRSAEAAEFHGAGEGRSNDYAGWDALFADVAVAFRQADFGFVNLETPVAPKHSVGS